MEILLLVMRPYLPLVLSLHYEFNN